MVRNIKALSSSIVLTLLLAGGCASGEEKSAKPASASTQEITATESVPSSTGRGYAKVRLGVRPSMAEGGEPGVYVQSVSPGTTAANGGLEPGDLIVAWNGEDLVDVMDMLGRLRSHEPGDEVDLVVIRDGAEIQLQLEMQASNREEQN